LAHARILDAGCGSGALARTIASHKPNWEVFGVDLNPSYIAYATVRSKEARLNNLSFEQGNLQSLSFENNSFDVIWTRFVFYFLPDPAAAIAEFKRIIRPSGLIVFSLHNWRTTVNYPEDPRLQDRERRVFAGLADWQVTEQLPSMLTSAGYCDVSVEIELDRIYTSLGRIEHSNRLNIEDVLKAGIDRVHNILGSRADAESFVVDLLRYYDREDTYTYSMLWTIKCRAP
jgi:SAM-dependent methyltransferase